MQTHTQTHGTARRTTFGTVKLRTVKLRTVKLHHGTVKLHRGTVKLGRGRTQLPTQSLCRLASA
jgi:hypothetical protein